MADLVLHSKLVSGLKLAGNSASTPVGNLVAAPAAALAFTVQQPGLQQRAPNLVQVTYGLDIWMNELAPTVNAGVPLAVTPPAASFAFTARTPVVSQVTSGNVVNAPVTSFAFTPRNPGAQGGWVPVLPPTAGITFTPRAPSISQDAGNNTVAPLAFFSFSARQPFVVQADTAIRPPYTRIDFNPRALRTPADWIAAPPAAAFAFNPRAPKIPAKSLPRVQLPLGDGVDARASNLPTGSRTPST
jgi:hypothetical protein